jgi:hypothetical protein
MHDHGVAALADLHRQRVGLYEPVRPGVQRLGPELLLHRRVEALGQVRFAKGDRKAEVMRPYLGRQAATGRSGVAAIGVAQEYQRVWAAYRRETKTAAPQFTFAKADRRVTCYYFYLWDEGFGPCGSW